MVLKSIISSWEGTISCKIWKNKTTKPKYIILMWKLLKTSTWSREAQASEFWVFQLRKLSNLVPYCLDIKNEYLGPFCTSATLLWHNGWNTLMATEKHCMWQIQRSQVTAQIHIQCPLFRRQHNFVPRPVLAPLSTALCVGPRFLDLSDQFFDLSLSCKRPVYKTTAKKHWDNAIQYIYATV